MPPTWRTCLATVSVFEVLAEKVGTSQPVQLMASSKALLRDYKVSVRSNGAIVAHFWKLDNLKEFADRLPEMLLMEALKDSNLATCRNGEEMAKKAARAVLDIHERTTRCSEFEEGKYENSVYLLVDGFDKLPIIELFPLGGPDPAKPNAQISHHR